MKTVNNFVSPGHAFFETPVKSLLPQHATVCFYQSEICENQCRVEEGDIVREGQSIAVPEGHFVSGGTEIHSSVPGKVESIFTCTAPDGKLCRAVKIKTEGEFTYLGKKQNPCDWKIFSAATLVDSFRSKGIVNTFHSVPVPLATQIKNCTLRDHRFVVVRMFDEDTSRFTDLFTATKYTDQVVQGAMIAARAFEAKGIAFVVPRKAEFTINESHAEGLSCAVVSADSQKYPCGFMQQLMRLVRKTSHMAGYEVFKHINHNCLFLDPETCLAIYEGIVCGIPVVEKFVHVNGTCLKASGMFKVRTGTLIRDLVEQCGGFKERPAKIVVNGRLVGNEISSLDIPVTNYVKSVEFISSGELSVQERNPCIRCGKCRIVCPEHLIPDVFYLNFMKGYSMPKKFFSSALLCSECYMCNSVCPSRLSLCQAVISLKQYKDKEDD